MFGRSSASARQSRGLILFCAEQGFAGTFSERVLDAAPTKSASMNLIVGTRGAAIASERGIKPDWSAHGDAGRCHSGFCQPAGRSDLQLHGKPCHCGEILFFRARSPAAASRSTATPFFPSILAGFAPDRAAGAGNALRRSRCSSGSLRNTFMHSSAKPPCTLLWPRMKQA